MAAKSVASVISMFGASVKPKLSNKAISGAPEDQLRGPLETLLQDLADLGGLASNAIHFVGETTLAHLKTRPDYAVTVNNALVGFIEVKAPGKGADPRKFSDLHDKEQWSKLKSLPNLMYTDGNAFSLWHNGELEGKIIQLDGDIETAGSKLEAPPTLLPVITSFFQWAPSQPANAKALAKISAHLCRLLRDEVIEQMELGNVSLTHLAMDWRKLLFPQADDEQFADGYAQAVTFGLLVARALDIPLANGIETAALKLKKTNSLIGTALQLLTEDAANQEALKTSLNTLTRVLDEVNWSVISKDEPEAWLYFYEKFLEVYDNKLRKLTGSYYTPPEVVSAVVRLVDDALRSPLFERSLGLASDDVTIADPAVGTGTFLLGVLRKIGATLTDAQGAGAAKSAIVAASHRLFGFELQFGPFAVAQLRLIAEIRALVKTTGKDKTSTPVPNLNLFITDTLGNPFVEEEQLPQIVEAVARSRREANEVKRGQPIMVVIGNPPYKNHAGGLGSWIEHGSDGRPAPLEWWTPPPDWGVSAHTHHLKNLYIYFWRWASLKVFGSGWSAATGEPEIARQGIVCFITAAGYLNGPAFLKMREDLRRTCSDIWVIDCSPEGHQPDVPTRIFQGVQQTVCIVLAASAAEKNRETPARLHYITLPEGKRQGKFAALAKLTLEDSNWIDGPSGWRAPFLAQLGNVWASFPPLQAMFTWSGSGVTPHRSWPISPDIQSLERRWEVLRTEKDQGKKETLFHRDRDRHVMKIIKLDLGQYPVRPVSVANDQKAVIPPVRYAYRSFDRQWIVPDNRLLSMPRPKLWSAYSNSQVYVTALERSTPSGGPAITLTDLVPDLDHYKGSFGGRVYPLWANAAANQSNIRPELLELLAESYGKPVSPEDVMAYIAAVLAHPAFTSRFAKDLSRPGLRLPLTADAKLFSQATELGREVIWLHTYGERFIDVGAGRPRGAPRMEKADEPTIPAKGGIPSAPESLPDTLIYDAANKRLHVGTGYVDNVTLAMWEFEVSGKRVIWQWFSYRKLDRSRPVIGDRRPPSPLEKIQPEGWLPEYTTDLLNLLRVLGRLTALEPAQAELLANICEGALIPVETLKVAGLMKTSDNSEEEVDPED